MGVPMQRAIRVTVLTPKGERVRLIYDEDKRIATPPEPSGPNIGVMSVMVGGLMLGDHVFLGGSRVEVVGLEVVERPDQALISEYIAALNKGWQGVGEDHVCKA